MIIQCPNCSTKFKINDNLIPPEGKKVKCSFCNHIWKTKNITENSSNAVLWVFWITTIFITSIIIYVGLIIVYGNKIPIPIFLAEILTNYGIPINGGNLFGRTFDR